MGCGNWRKRAGGGMMDGGDGGDGGVLWCTLCWHGRDVIHDAVTSRVRVGEMDGS